jgi:hypothetical protein
VSGHRPLRLIHLRPSTPTHIHHVWLQIEKRECVHWPLKEGECLEAQVEHHKTHKTALVQSVIEEGRETRPAGSTSFFIALIKRHIAVVGKVSATPFLDTQDPH